MRHMLDTILDYFGSLTSVIFPYTGNDALHLLTNQRPYQLRIDLEDFQNETVYALYSNFSIADSNDLYKLSLGSYYGTAGR